MAFAFDHELLAHGQAHELVRRKLYQLLNQIPPTASAMTLTHPGVAGRQHLRDTVKLATEFIVAVDEYFEDPTNATYEGVHQWKQACFEADGDARLDVVACYRDFQRWSNLHDILPCSLERFTVLLAEEGGVRCVAIGRAGRDYVQGRLKPGPSPAPEVEFAMPAPKEPASGPEPPQAKRRGRPLKLPGEGPAREPDCRFRKAAAV